jgi:hypothetical protein
MVRASVLSVLAIGLLASSALAVPRVNVMPGTATDAKQYRPLGLVLWGNANGGDGTAIGFTYEFTVDASPSFTIIDDGLLSGVVTSDKFISETVDVSFTGSATRATLVGHLTVTDTGDLSTDTDTFILDIVGPTDPISDTPAEALLIDVNAAINNGLRALYLMQATDGSWSFYETEGAGVTGFSLWAFENQGYFAKDDPTRDIYAEFLGKSIDWLTGGHSGVVAFVPAVQPAGNPDADGNGRAIQLNSSGVEGYSSPIATAALVSALDTARPIINGPAIGEPLKNIIQDSCDYVAFGQNDIGSGTARGGWRYFANIGSSDKSADSWNYVAMEGGETVSLVIVPDFVKSEAEYSLVYDQALDGRFGYTGPGPIGDGVGHATSGAGLAGLAFVTTTHVPTWPGADPSLDTTDEKREAVLTHLGNNWLSPTAFRTCCGYGNHGNHYAMWTITRALRLNGRLSEGGVPPVELLYQAGTPFDWELSLSGPDTSMEGYFPYLVRTQNPDGSWDNDSSGFYNTPFDTATAELILSPSVFATSCSPVSINFDIDLEGRAIATQTRVDDTYLDAGCHMEGKSGETGFIGTYATNPALDPTTDDLFPTTPTNVVNTRPSATRTDSDWGTITFFFQDRDGSVRSAAQCSVDFLDVEDSGFGGGRGNTKLQAFDASNALVGEVDVPAGPNGNVFHAEIGSANSGLLISKVVVSLGDRDDSAAMDTFQYCLNPPSFEVSLYPKDGVNTLEVEPFAPIRKAFLLGKKSNGRSLVSPELTDTLRVKVTAQIEGRAKIYNLRSEIVDVSTAFDNIETFNVTGPTLHNPAIIEKLKRSKITFTAKAEKVDEPHVVSTDAKQFNVQSR